MAIMATEVRTEAVTKHVDPRRKHSITQAPERSKNSARSSATNERP